VAAQVAGGQAAHLVNVRLPGGPVRSWTEELESCDGRLEDITKLLSFYQNSFEAE